VGSVVSWRDRVAALLGVSAYTAPPPGGPASLEDPGVEAIRQSMGGQLAPMPHTQTRWFLADLETAQQNADAGDLSTIGRLHRWMRSDGVYAGHLASRTGKAVRLPRRFYGDPEMIAELTRRTGARSVFDDMSPTSELERMADDGLIVGVGVGELVPVQGRDYPVLVRLDPEHLRYRWQENRWYYSSIAGLLPVTPGDGRWVLHTPGGRMSPWQAGLWPAVGRAAITKAHAELNIANWEHKWANPARVAKAPIAATDEQLESFWRRVLAWGMNNVFGLKPGWDIALLETNGNGWESPLESIKRAERTYVIAICGQEVTATGGSGFSNADVPERVLTSLIDTTAEGIAYTLNTQVIPQWVVRRYGERALSSMPVLESSSKPPKDQARQADMLQKLATALKLLREELAMYNRKLNIAEITTDYGIPIAGDVDGDGNPDAPELVAPPAADGVANDVQEPEPDAAAALAEKMTEHAVERCQHGSLNRCRLCGVERVRDFETDQSGNPQWKVVWRPIEKAAA
jgi:hypothetical protein